ncbi:tyrosine-type recombinase/integrase [Paraglaciecola marina]|uniref:tyrosine-type recombinase/integrase n=1 Tax=Paraglaciecola marina TaxID=2500157 RepID=UPI00105ED8BD|nr:integrase family protein [Paraglaciecola marina]
MSTNKINKSFVDKITLPETGQAIYRDNELKGFGLRVTAGGAKAFILEKRINRKVKRITLGKYPEITAEKARKIALEYLGEIATGINPIAKRKQQEAQGMTLYDVFQEYKLVKNDLKPKTYAQYEMYLDGELKDWKNKPLSSITKDSVVKRHSELKSKLSPSYANNVMRVLSAIFRFANIQFEDDSGNSLFPVNPVERINQLKAWAKEPRRQTVIKQHELANWYQALSDMKFNSSLDLHHTASDYMLFLLLTGLRRNEGAKLLWEHVDFEDKTFHIPDTKNNEPLTLPFSDLIESILLYRLRFKTNEYVFSNRRTGYLAHPSRALKYLKETSGIEFTFHDLRRTFITVAESLDISAYAIKSLVNHKSGGDVTQGYVINNLDRLREPMQRITNFFIEHANIQEEHYVPKNN